MSVLYLQQQYDLLMFELLRLTVCASKWQIEFFDNVANEVAINKNLQLNYE